MARRFQLTIVVAVILSGMAWAFHAVAAEQAQPIRFERAGLTADDLVDTYGLNIYKFKISAAMSGKYRVIVRERESEESPWKNLFAEALTVPDDPNLFLFVSFTRADGQFGRVLLSGGQKKADFGVKLCTDKRCYSGMSTVIPTPLANHDNMVLYVRQSGSEGDQGDTDCLQLLAIKPSSRTKEKDKSCAELLLMRIP